eukprot:TRINITY_DN65622_c0_g1_i1.p1 TRINITY_DN65622_c0_g1~~TRINITY_DN65622_c0_g1_i1.p1  ORF type:complete len:118 (+),score=0.52 TRINITY_DN65622_c0_g1_i1:51-404(+)
MITFFFKRRHFRDLIYLNTRYTLTSIPATPLPQCLQHPYLNTRYTLTSIPATPLPQYLLHPYLNTRCTLSRFASPVEYIAYGEIELKRCHQRCTSVLQYDLSDLFFLFFKYQQYQFL